MTTGIPFDPALPNLSLMFDGRAVLELLDRHTTETRRSEIVNCRPRYVRYKPGTSCLVEYDLEIRSGGRHFELRAHVRAFADGRGQARMTRRKLTRLISRTTATYPAAPLEWATYLPELDGIFSVFPVDYDLRSLLDIGSAPLAQQHLRQMLEQPALTVTREPALIRYKPGRKALFRIEVDNYRHQTVYGKIHAADRSHSIRQATTALIAAGIPTPPVLGTLPELGFIGHAEIAGEPMTSHRASAHYAGELAELAAVLDRLHRVPLYGLRPHSLIDEIAQLHETSALLGLIIPELRDHLHRIVETIARGFARIAPEYNTSHGDFYDDQAIVANGSISLIDFDEIRSAHPLLDIGNMMAHLRAGEYREAIQPGSTDAFLDAMSEHRVVGDEVAYFEAAGLLKLAPGPFRRVEPEWPRHIEELVALAEHALPPENLRHLRSVRGTTALAARIPDDPKLPQLTTVCNLARMSTRLAEQTGHPDLHIRSMECVRHKPGRRAILRWEVEVEGKPNAFYAKTFASQRAPKVYEIATAIAEAQAFGDQVRVPKSVALFPDIRTIVQSAVLGEPITDILFEPSTAVVARIADALGSFHASAIDLGRQHTLERELSPLPERIQQLGNVENGLRDRASALLDLLRSGKPEQFEWRNQPIHRDFYHDQILWDGQHLAILDLDDAAMGEPAVDIANFVAHLMLLGSQRSSSVFRLQHQIDAFLERYRSVGPDCDPALIDWLVASTAIRLAGIHGNRDHGRVIATQLLDVAEWLLRPASRGESFGISGRVRNRRCATHPYGSPATHTRPAPLSSNARAWNLIRFTS